MSTAVQLFLVIFRQLNFLKNKIGLKGLVFTEGTDILYNTSHVQFADFDSDIVYSQPKVSVATFSFLQSLKDIPLIRFQNARSGITLKCTA